VTANDYARVASTPCVMIVGLDLYFEEDLLCDGL